MATLARVGRPSPDAARSASLVGSAGEFEKAATHGEDDSQGDRPKRIVAEGVQEQKTDADAGGALQVAFPGRRRLPRSPAPSSVPDEEGQDHADPQPPGLQPCLEVVVVSL
ncbi:MAG: hypothetical protein RL093_1730, partial [Pseudomonadota bacterium]